MSPPVWLGKEPTILTLPSELDQLIGWRWPDALWVSGQRHSDECYTVWILDADYTYTEARAHLSLDGRWTLSPTGSPWHTAETDGKEGMRLAEWQSEGA